MIINETRTSPHNTPPDRGRKGERSDREMMCHRAIHPTGFVLANGRQMDEMSSIFIRFTSLAQNENPFSGTEYYFLLFCVCVRAHISRSE